MVTKIFVSLEIGYDGAGAFVPRCPGCWVFGRTQERALTKVKSAIDRSVDRSTARTVLRRLVDHERLHTKYIERCFRLYEKRQ